MNQVPVKWVSPHSLYAEPWRDLREVPVVPLSALREALERWGVVTEDTQP